MHYAYTLPALLAAGAIAAPVSQDSNTLNVGTASNEIVAPHTDAAGNINVKRAEKDLIDGDGESDDDVLFLGDGILKVRSEGDFIGDDDENDDSDADILGLVDSGLFKAKREEDLLKTNLLGAVNPLKAREEDLLKTNLLGAVNPLKVRDEGVSKRGENDIIGDDDEEGEGILGGILKVRSDGDDLIDDVIETGDIDILKVRSEDSSEQLIDDDHEDNGGILGTNILNLKARSEGDLIGDDDDDDEEVLSLANFGVLKARSEEDLIGDDDDNDHDNDNDGDALGLGDLDILKVRSEEDLIGGGGVGLGGIGLRKSAGAKTEKRDQILDDVLGLLHLDEVLKVRSEEGKSASKRSQDTGILSDVTASTPLIDVSNP